MEVYFGVAVAVIFIICFGWLIGQLQSSTDPLPILPSWKRLPNVPINIRNFVPISVTANTLLFVGSKEIYQYNIITNIFTPFIEYHNILCVSIYYLYFEEKTDILYIYYNNQSINHLKCMQVKLKNKEITIDDNVNIFLPLDLKDNCTFIQVKQNEYYLVNEICRYTFVDSINQKCINLKFPGYSVNHGLIYLKSQQLILVFGGDSDTYRNTFWLKKSVRSITSYSFVTKQWKTENVCLDKPTQKPGYVVTNDEQYLLIFGGLNGYNCYDYEDEWIYNDCIQIVNLFSMECYTSKIKCPMITNTDMKLDCYDLKAKIVNVRRDAFYFGLIYWFLRDISGSFKVVIPNDIINLIGHFYNLECSYVHLISGDMHWRILLSDIIKKW
eukprot:536955_1